jgi:cytochrome c2
MTLTRVRISLAAAVIAALVAAAGCGSNHTTNANVLPGASPDVGRRLIERYGCGSCHEIPGVKGARGLVGPPLTKFGRRGFIAGELANTPDNLIHWIQHPRDVEPGTDMPDRGVTYDEARNIAAYLERLG